MTLSQWNRVSETTISMLCGPCGAEQHFREMAEEIGRPWVEAREMTYAAFVSELRAARKAAA